MPLTMRNKGDRTYIYNGNFRPSKEGMEVLMGYCGIPGQRSTGSSQY